VVAPMDFNAVRREGLFWVEGFMVGPVWSARFHDV